MLFLSFFYDVKNGHFCSYPNSKGNILPEALTFFAVIGHPNLKGFLLNAHNWQLWQRSHNWESNAMI